MILKKKEDVITGYKKQVQLASSTIKRLVAHIQQNNKPNTIIIVAGDHGYRTEEGNNKGYTFQNLNAFYFPRKDYTNLYDSISPVNSFRVVLNNYFNAQLPLLIDSNILVTEHKETYLRKKSNQK